MLSKVLVWGYIHSKVLVWGYTHLAYVSLFLQHYYSFISKKYPDNVMSIPSNNRIIYNQIDGDDHNLIVYRKTLNGHGECCTHELWIVVIMISSLKIVNANLVIGRTKTEIAMTFRSHLVVYWFWLWQLLDHNLSYTCNL